MASQPADLTTQITALGHFEAGRLAEAAGACQAILQRVPHDWLALRLLGGVREKEGDFDQAARCFAAALQAAPPGTGDTFNLLNELAGALLRKRDFEGALVCCRRALAQSPHDPGALHNCGHALVALNRHAEALEKFRQALMAMPDSAELRHNEAIAMLALGMWPQAWERLEARLKIPSLHVADGLPEYVPHWRGEFDIGGKTILLQAEQGLGDTLQYIRYLPWVTQRGARVVLRVQPVLGKLLANFPGADKVITFYDHVSDVDFQCPLMSLPMAFGTTVAKVPARVPYLSMSPEYLLLWQALLGIPRRKRIGIAWSGMQHAPHRSLPLAMLAPLLERPDLDFHALQHEIPAADRSWLAAHPMVVDHSPKLKEFADNAAVVALMDLVVTIDTSIAHLAGALGKPVWIMLPFSADCRWLLDRADTPWYPTARLFRQRQPGDWHGVVAEVVRALSG